MTETVEQRLAALEKEVSDLKNESHKILSESAKAMLTLQQRLTSVRGPEGGRGEKGEPGAPGRDGLSEFEVRSLVQSTLAAWEQKELVQIRKEINAAVSEVKNHAERFHQAVGSLRAKLA